MLNIKSVFVPQDSRAPLNSMEAAQQNVGPSPQKPVKNGFNSAKTRMFLGAAFLFLTIMGGASAFYLSTTGQDLRQQAAGRDSYDCTGVPGCGKDCSRIQTAPNGAYCGSTSPDSCLKCENGIAVGGGDSCTGLPCDDESGYNTPTCSGGAKPGQHACAGGPNDVCQGGDCCKVCVQVNVAGKSPTARWESTDNAACAGLTCSREATPTPGGPILSCASMNVTPGTASCSTMNAYGCFGYGSCHSGSNYDACVPTSSNTCTYTMKNGQKCSAPCPDTLGTLTDGKGGKVVRCQCSNGQSTIGVLPEGGSCETLCACTGNDCEDCKPTEPPDDKPTSTPRPTATPTPIPTLAPAQCTNIKMLTPDGAELTGDADKTLKPGDAVKFMCAANGTVDNYEFRVIMPDGSIQTAANNPNLAAVGATTGNFILPAVGKFTAQCRICTIPVCAPGTICNKMKAQPVCQEYEPIAAASVAPRPTITTLPTATPSCGGVSNIACPSNYVCKKPNGNSDSSGICVQAAPTVSALSCGGIAGLKCPANYICTMPTCPPSPSGVRCSIRPETMGTCVLTSPKLIPVSCGGTQGLTCPLGSTCNAAKDVPNAVGTCIFDAAKAPR